MNPDLTRELAAVNWPALAQTMGRVAIVLLLATCAYVVLGLLTRKLEASIRGGEGTIAVHEQRAATLVGLARSVGLVFIVVVALFMVLQAVGVDIAPLLAGAGVVGLAISFGAQSLVKDVISGLFILFENQFGIGDVIRIGSASGAVERMTLRATFLRDLSGTMHVIPNGEIKQVSNLTRSWSRAVLDIGVAYHEDVDRAMEVMREVGREMWDDSAWRPLLVEEASVLGVEALADSAVTIRMVSKTLPLKQWEVARELRRRLKRRFDAEGISIPFPQRTLHLAGAQQALVGQPEETPS